MDRHLFDLIQTEVPKMNPLICKGLVTEQIKEAERYIEMVIESAADTFPPGLEYVECKRCTPNEEFSELTRERYNKQVYDLARSDFYMVKYIFKYNGELLPPRYMMLPFLGKAGTITIRGSQFVVNPVITDKLFSVDHSRVFMPITRDKITFERQTHSYYVDKQRVTTSVVWGHIHHLAKKKSSLRTGTAKITATTCLAHYLFALDGVTAAYKRFANCDVKLGHTTEICKETYPEKDWVICKSSGIMPASITDKFYKHTDVAIAIPRKAFTPFVEALTAGLFYVVDHFPERLRPEWLDNSTSWRITLGHLIYKNNESEGKLQEDVNAHFDSLDAYVDTKTRETFAEEGIGCRDIYEIFAYMIQNMPDMIINADVSSLYDKRLTVLRYLLQDLVNSIFRMTFALKRKLKKEGRELKKTDIIKAMDKDLKSTAIVQRLTSKHGEVNTMAYPGDNMVFKLTSRIILQSSATGTNKNSAGMLKDPSKHLHASLAEVGSYLNQPKFDPTGQSRINPYLNVGVDGIIHQSEEHKELIDNVNRRIKR